MRMSGVWMLAAAATTWTAAWAEPPSDVLAYGVFAMQDARIRTDARVEGDAGCLFEALVLARHTQLTGLAAAPAITRRSHARAVGGYFCTTLNGESSGCAPMPNPLVATPSIVLVGPPSNADVSVARRSKATSALAAGAYGRFEAGTAAEVMLAGGSYQFEAIDVRRRAEVVCLAACDVTVRGRMSVGARAQVGAAEGLDPSTVVFLVAGQGETVGFSAKRRASVRGLVYAPSADVKVGAKTRIAGALVGNRVDVGKHARVERPSDGT